MTDPDLTGPDLTGPDLTGPDLTGPDLTGPGRPNPVEAVFFDFGGVFIDSPFAAVEVAAGKLGVDAAELVDVIFGPYDADSDHPWHRLERGEVSFASARSDITGLAEERGLGALDPISVLAEMGGAGLVVREFMADAVRAFRARGLKTGLITNNIAEFGSAWKGLLPIEELFDDVVDSSAVGVRKPDPAIYLLACERIGVEPGASLFIDDYQGNVDGAARVGMVAVCCGYTVDSARSALAELVTAVERPRPVN